MDINGTYAENELLSFCREAKQSDKGRLTTNMKTVLDSVGSEWKMEVAVKDVSCDYAIQSHVKTAKSSICCKCPQRMEEVVSAMSSSHDFVANRVREMEQNSCKVDGKPNSLHSYRRQHRIRNRRIFSTPANRNNKCRKNSNCVDPIESLKLEIGMEDSLTVSSPISKGSTGLYPAADCCSEWNWNFCEEYFGHISEERAAYLASVYADCEEKIARQWRCIDIASLSNVEIARFKSILSRYQYGHVSDEEERQYQRGRFYQDVWEEEDYYMKQQKLQRLMQIDSSLNQAEHIVLRSNHHLVHRYDDDCYRAYMKHLEARYVQYPDFEDDIIENYCYDTGRECHKRTVRSEHPYRTLPLIDVRKWHAAAAGRGRREAQLHHFDRIHPACIMKEDSRNCHDGACHPGNLDHCISKAIVDDDDILTQLQFCQSQLAYLAVSNWRRVATLKDISQGYLQGQFISSDREMAVRQIEELYLLLYPIKQDNTKSKSLDAIAASQSTLSKSKTSLNRHLPAYDNVNLQNILEDILSVTKSSKEEAVAVSGSVIFGSELQIGDEVDVLDQSGEWTTGIVILTKDTSNPALRHLKFRLFSCHDMYTDWITVNEARILPKGCFKDNTSFYIQLPAIACHPPQMVCLKREHALILARSLHRRMTLHTSAARKKHRRIAIENADRIKKRRRRRTQLIA